MRFKRNIKLDYGLSQIDIAPLINTVFLILIFFILTSSFVFQSGASIDLARSITSDAVKQGAVIIVSSENAIYLNDKIVSLQELGNRLKPVVKDNSTLLIKADRKASWQRIADIWDLCRDAGFKKINIATNQE